MFEIDPNLDGVASNFSSMNFAPDPILPGWDHIDATTSGLVGLTGGGGPRRDVRPATGRCAPSLTYSPHSTTDGDPATILTASIRKGRDFPFSGAVDALVINDQTFDFEPLGVVTTPSEAAATVDV